MAIEQKDIKIYLAVADDLKPEYNEIAELVDHLNHIFRAKKINFEIIPHNQGFGEINECELSLALYYTKFGDYSKQDFESAYEYYKKNKNPRKIYVFFKNDQEIDSKISKELKNFKDNFATAYGHFFCKFEHIDTMKLRFSMDLNAYQNTTTGENLLKVEDQKVYFGDLIVSNLNNIPFASANKEYIRLRDSLLKINENILKYPNDDGFKAERTKLEKEFQQHQEALFNTAMEISKQSGSIISKTRQNAIELFENGDMNGANTLLSHIEQKAEQHLTNYLQYEKAAAQNLKLAKQERENIIEDIEALILKTKTALGDTSYSIDDRIKQAKQAFAMARNLALKIDYEKEKLIDLLFNYVDFLFKYAFYDDALPIAEETLELSINEYGKEHEKAGKAYRFVGLYYDYKNKFDDALKYYNTALEIRQKVLGEEHQDTAQSYNNVGVVYSDLGDDEKAFEYYQKALKIRQKLLGAEHVDTALSYNNIGRLYLDKGEYDKALEEYQKSLKIHKNIFGEEHQATAKSYNNIGNVYSSKGDYDNSLKYLNKSLDIRKKTLGLEHPDTATSYDSIGFMYLSNNDFDKSLEFYHKALTILKKILGEEHVDVATSYSNIGAVYDNKGDYNNSLEYHNKSLEILKKIFGKEHRDMAINYNNISSVHYSLGNYDISLEYCEKALKIFQENFGMEHPYTIASNDAIQKIKEKKSNNKSIKAKVNNQKQNPNQKDKTRNQISNLFKFIIIFIIISFASLFGFEYFFQNKLKNENTNTNKATNNIKDENIDEIKNAIIDTIADITKDNQELIAPKPKTPGQALIYPSKHDIIGLNKFNPDNINDIIIKALVHSQSPLINVRVESTGGQALSWKTGGVKSSAMGIIGVQIGEKIINPNDIPFNLEIKTLTEIDLLIQTKNGKLDEETKLRIVFFHADGSRTYARVK